MNFLEAAKKGAECPEPVVVSRPPVFTHKRRKDKYKKSPTKPMRKHECHKCKETLTQRLGVHLHEDLETHLNDVHKPKEGFYYVVCPKCMYYLYTSNDVSHEEAINVHHSEKHFMKTFKEKKPKATIVKIDDKEFEDVSRQYGVDKLLKETALDVPT